MKLVGVVSTVLIAAAPVAAGAQGHGGMPGAARVGVGPVSIAHNAGWGPGFGPVSAAHGAGFHGHGGFDHHDHGFHDHGSHDHGHHHFHGHGVWWGWGPDWGWGWPGDCGPYGDACDWGEESGPGAPSDDYGYTDAPVADAACGAWLRHGGGYVWTRRVCGGDLPAADPPRAAAVASNECSDWVWRADLHRSVCRRAARAAG